MSVNYETIYYLIINKDKEWGMTELFSLTPEVLEMLTRISVAAGLGALIGLERDVHGRNAGLRTHLLVSMGSALFMVMSELVSLKAREAGADLTPVNADPGRIAAQVVTGIGFIGAGAILKSGLSVRGLTTAATLWIVASIGMAAGTGSFAIASITTFLTIVSLVLLNYFELLYKKDSYRRVVIEMNGFVSVNEIKKYVAHKSIDVKSFQIERDYVNNKTTVTLMLRVFNRGSSDTVYAEIMNQLEDSSVDLLQVKWGHQLE